MLGPENPRHEYLRRVSLTLQPVSYELAICKQTMSSIFDCSLSSLSRSRFLRILIRDDKLMLSLTYNGRESDYLLIKLIQLYCLLSIAMRMANAFATTTRVGRDAIHVRFTLLRTPHTRTLR